jgi:Putative porin
MHFKKARRLAIQAVKVLLLAAMSAASRGLCQDSTNAPTSNGQDPLLDLLIQKGILTQQEADRVEAEAQSRRTNNAAQMPSTQSFPGLKIASAFKNMELFGDARLRYEDRYAADIAGNSIDLQRFRYAIRFGVRGDLFDQFYFGLRLDTSPNPRSDFVTLGTATASSSSYYYGPFGKQNAGVNIGEVYLGWHPESWVDLTVGKMPNPLFTSTMVWNSTITPEGFAERFKYPVGPAQFFANFGQFLYEDLNPNSASGGLGINGVIGQHTDNIFMLAWQGGLNYQITPRVKAEVAATIYNYIGLGRSTVNSLSALAPYYGDPYVGEGDYFLAGGTTTSLAPGYNGFGTGNSFGGYGSLNYPLNQVGLDNLEVIEIPFEFEYHIPGPHLEARLFGDFAYNLEGAQRAEEAAAAYSAIQTLEKSDTPAPQSHTFAAQTGDVKAYQIGVGIGSDDVTYGPMQGLVYGTSSPRHAWEVRTYWQHIEQYSLDPNILDTDFFNGLENLQGVYVAAAYAFTGNVIGTFRYGHASRINDQLGTGGSSLDIPQINPVNSFNIYQVDLTLRF